MQEKIVEALMIEFDPGEPILLDELSFDDVSDAALRQTLKRLVDRGKLERFDRGVYYFTEETVLRNEKQLVTSTELLRKYPDLADAAASAQANGSAREDAESFAGRARRRPQTLPPSPEDVIERKYITDGEEVYGFWSGLTLENMMGVSPQVPVVLEVVSNKEKSFRRKAMVGHLSCYVKKPRVEVTRENCETLMLLDVVNGVSVDQLNRDERRNLLAFAARNRLRKSQVYELAQCYPSHVSKRLIESGVVDALA